MSKMLEGKVVIVTGSAGGIGEAAVELFAEEGARLAVVARKAEGAEEIAGKARDLGAEAIALGCDLEMPDQVEKMVADTVAHYGRIDGAFNNAGISAGNVDMGGKLAHEWTEEAFMKVLQVNVLGTWRCMKAQIPHMLEQGSGSIVNTTSLAALTGFVSVSGYVASKFALAGLTQTAALEYAPTIRINSLCPGYIDTPLIADSMSRRGDAIRAKIPFGRLGQPRELAELACWLLSDRASYATGANFIADGGYMAG